MQLSSPMVSTDWLAEHLGAPDIRVADASWYLPQAERKAKEEYEAAHIPGAVFFDIDDLSDKTSNLPHMLPSAAKFASRMRRLGLGDGNLIVIYDGAGIYSAPRAWWMLCVMGHKEVVVLDGGFPKWKRELRPIENMIPQPYPRHFTPREDFSLVRDFAQVMANLTTKREVVIDARSRNRFLGQETEPRHGVRPGHIPGSKSLPYAKLTESSGTLKSPERLLELFRAHEIDPNHPAITTCGSGITAAIAVLALTVAGAKDVSLYDGSWSEWGARAEAPISVE
ncbi:MAG TPA: 3-mercaptopyruvate sulfurtransferase [Rhizomicrobium sp.]